MATAQATELSDRLAQEAGATHRDTVTGQYWKQKPNGSGTERMTARGEWVTEWHARVPESCVVL